MKFSNKINARFLYLAPLYLFLMVATQIGTTPIAAQDDPFEFGGLLEDDDDGSPAYTFSGDFSVTKNDDGQPLSGELNVRLEIKEGWHGYSQKILSGQSPTKIIVAESSQYKIVGPFVPDQTPKAGIDEVLNAPKEEFEGTVTWTAPIEIAAGVDAAQLGIEFRVRGQVCKDRCIPFSKDDSTVVAGLSEVKLSDAVTGQQEFKSYLGHGSISGRLLNPVVKPGESATLEITAKMDEGWHVYAFEKSKREESISLPTMLVFEKSGDWAFSEPTASGEPIEHEVVVADQSVLQRYHEGEVTWTVKLTPPKDATSGKFNLGGKFVYQLCDEGSCDAPTVADFTIPIKVGEATSSEAVGLTFVQSDVDAEDMGVVSSEFWQRQGTMSGAVETISFVNLISYLLMGLVAGFILNAMPCVLPVIGLKIMSFVAQAGEDRKKVFMLNLAFSIGLISVFMVLATLSAFFGFGWGDLLTKSMTGSIVITSVVFAFGLSMLGVWEIPIPGMSGSSTVGKKAEEEGLSGAFFLGILTTILATPCTGPMLIPALAVTAGQPTWVTYAIFGSIGLGMALPYLLIGVYPKLISWLPKPGAWMVTFKQITGFILMATVVFLLAGFSEKPRSEYMVAVLSLLLVIAFGCWWIGRSDEYMEVGKKVKAWGAGLGIIALGSFLAFSFLGPSEYKLDWQEFSKARLGELRDESRLVFIDFTGPN